MVRSPRDPAHPDPQDLPISRAGLDWIDENTMSSVLLRHYPHLRPALQSAGNAFEPWQRVGKAQADPAVTGAAARAAGASGD
jgi:hypothetical protein